MDAAAREVTAQIKQNAIIQNLTARLERLESENSALRTQNASLSHCSLSHSSNVGNSNSPADRRSISPANADDRIRTRGPSINRFVDSEEEEEEIEAQRWAAALRWSSSHHSPDQSSVSSPVSNESPTHHAPAARQQQLAPACDQAPLEQQPRYQSSREELHQSSREEQHQSSREEQYQAALEDRLSFLQTSRINRTAAEHQSIEKQCIAKLAKLRSNSQAAASRSTATLLEPAKRDPSEDLNSEIDARAVAKVDAERARVCVSKVEKVLRVEALCVERENVTASDNLPHQNRANQQISEAPFELPKTVVPAPNGLPDGWNFCPENGGYYW